MYITMVVHFLLKHNFFVFNGDYFLQITGASMGAQFSPSIANIYVAWWEYKFLFSEQNPFMSTIFWYGRYIDDLLFIADSGMAAVPALNTFLDSNDMSLRFTVTCSPTQIAFLDMSLEGTCCGISSACYRKETSGNTILHAQSCHPTFRWVR